MSTEVKDDFEAAFEEVAQAAVKTPEQVATETKAAEEAAAAAAKADEGKTPEQVAAEAKAAEEAAAAAAAAAKANEGKTPEQVAAEAKAAEEAEAKAKLEAEATAKASAEAAAKAEAEAKATREAEEKAAREAAEAAVKPYEPTEEEAKALAKFKEEFPNEYIAMETRLKATGQDINARVAAAVKSVVDQMAPRLAAVEATTVQTAQERHLNTLRTAHPDFDAQVPKLAAWIKTQPAYLQPAMQQVYDGGAAADVVALMSDFKKATGVVAPTDDAAAKEAARVAAEAAARKGADDLEPVGSRRSAPSPRGGPDKKDYDGAWAELETATAGR